MKNFIIGADVSKKTLDCVLFDTNNEKMRASYIKINNNKNGLEELVKWMKEHKIVKSQAVVCMEYTGRYSVDFAELLGRKKIDFVLIPALKIKGAFAGARGKNDKMDAERIVAEYKKQIAAIEKEIKEVINSDEKMNKNYELLTSIPGISLVNAVNLIVFTGNFSFFADARKFASYSGVAPFEYSSGTSVNKGTHVSKMANKMLKADLSQAAKSAINFDPWLKKYYERKRKEGKSYGCVLNAVKFKLIERVFAVVKRGTPYVNTMKYSA